MVRPGQGGAPRRAEPRRVPACRVRCTSAPLSLRSRRSRCRAGLPCPPPVLRPCSLIPAPLHLETVPRPEPASALCPRRGSGQPHMHPACPAPGLGVPSPEWVPSCADGQRGCCGPVAGVLVPRAGLGLGAGAGLQRSCFLPTLLLEGAVIWPPLPRPGLLTQQPQGRVEVGETGFLDKKTPAWGTHGPDFFCEGGKSSPGFLSGFPAEDGVGLESALGPGALRCRPSRPGWTALPLGTTLCGSPVPAARGSAAAWLCSPVTPRPPPRVPWSSGAMPAPSSGSCPPSCSVRCLQVCPSSRKPPWVRSSLLTVTVPESHPLEGVWPRSPPHQCWPMVRRRVRGWGHLLGPWPRGGPGSSVHRACCFGCLNGRALCLVVFGGPSAWKTGVGGPRGHRERPGSGPRAASPCLSGGTASPPGVSQSRCWHDLSVCPGKEPGVQMEAPCPLGQQQWGHLVGSGPFLPSPGARMDAAFCGGC